MNNIKMELREAFKNYGFKISLILGLGLSIWQYFQYTIIPIFFTYNLYTPKYPKNLFDSWMGANFSQLPVFLFFLLLPIIASLPYSTSYLDDLNSGMIKNRILKSTRNKYFTAKYFATFLSGATAVILPLLINFLLTAMTLPALKPINSTHLYGIFPRMMWAELFYTNPFLYTFGYLIIIFIFSGLIAALSLPFSFFIKNKIAILLTPFLIYIFLYAFFNTLNAEKFSPYNFLPPSQPIYYISFGIILAEAVILLLAEIYFFIYRGAKNDVL